MSQHLIQLSPNFFQFNSDDDLHSRLYNPMLNILKETLSLTECPQTVQCTVNLKTDYTPTECIFWFNKDKEINKSVAGLIIAFAKITRDLKLFNEYIDEHLHSFPVNIQESLRPDWFMGTIIHTLLGLYPKSQVLQNSNETQKIRSVFNKTYRSRDKEDISSFICNFINTLDKNTSLEQLNEYIEHQKLIDLSDRYCRITKIFVFFIYEISISSSKDPSICQLQQVIRNNKNETSFS